MKAEVCFSTSYLALSGHVTAAGETLGRGEGVNK